MESASPPDAGGNAFTELRSSTPYRGGDFQTLDLSGVDLTGCDLQDTNLENVTGLRVRSLRNSVLAGAKLPAYIDKFTLIERTAELAKLARTSLLALVVAMTFYLLAIARATDAELILNSVSNKLPVIGIDVPIQTFYLFAPLILAVMFGFVNLYVLRMYESYMGLPAVFPDGLSRYEKVDGWLFSGLVMHLERDQVANAASLLGLQYFLCVLLLHIAFPALLAYVWWRYLFTHDVVLLTYLSALSAFTAYGSTWLWSARAHTILSAMRRPGNLPPREAGRLQSVIGCALGAALVAASFVCSLLLPFDAKTRHALPWSALTANLAGAEFTKPNREWEARYLAASPDHGMAVKVLREIPVVKLSDINLRGADARGLVAINANLARADLTGSDMSFSRLQGSDLQGAVIRRTRLDGADMSHANLSAARIERSGFKRDAILMAVNFTSSEIHAADFGGAHLAQSHFSLARIIGSQFEGTKLRGADFNSAQLKDVKFNGAHLDDSKFRTATLRAVDFTAADLERVDFTQAVFDHINLSGAKLGGAIGLTQAQLVNACGSAETRIEPALRPFLKNC